MTENISQAPRDVQAQPEAMASIQLGAAHAVKLLEDRFVVLR